MTGCCGLKARASLPRRSKAVLAGAIMLGAIATASLGLPWFDGGSYAPIKLPIAIASLAGAILMFVTGCVKFDRVGRALSAKVIVLIAASIAIGRVIDASGAAEFLGQALSLGLAYLPPALVLGGDHAVRHLPHQFCLQRHRRNHRYADRLQHRHPAGNAARAPRAGGAVRFAISPMPPRLPIRPTC